MARIYDNIKTKFTDGLQGIITNMGVSELTFAWVTSTYAVGILWLTMLMNLRATMSMRMTNTHFANADC